MFSSISRRISLAYQALRYGAFPEKKSREIPPISGDEVAEARIFFPLDKFFIFGHARSGTTMLARLVRLHPEVHCNYQAHFFTRPPLLEGLVIDQDIESWLARRSNRWNRGKDLSPVVLRAVGDFILEREARREGKRIVGDKSPNSLNDGDAVLLMNKIYPDARLVYIVRDGRDTAISHRIQAFVEFPDRLSKEDLKIRNDFSLDPTPFLEGKRSIYTEKGIREAAQGWVRNVEQTHRIGMELYADRYYSLRFEDLLERTWKEITQLWNFLGAEPAAPELEKIIMREADSNPDADWQKEKSIDIARSFQKGRQGTWHSMFTNRDKQVFHQVAGKTLETWGYLDYF